MAHLRQMYRIPHGKPPHGIVVSRVLALCHNAAFKHSHHALLVFYAAAFEYRHFTDAFGVVGMVLGSALVCYKIADWLTEKE